MGSFFSPAEVEIVEKGLSAISTFQQHSFKYVEETKSTNDDLKQILGDRFSHKILLARYQTAGRGQFERKWQNTPGQALMFSFTWKVDKNLFPKKFPVSLMAGITILDALNSFPQSVADKLWLKWPNDIWSAKGKLCGVLVEAQHYHNEFQIVIGIGINLTKISQDGILTSSLDELGFAELDKSKFLLAFFNAWEENWTKESVELANKWMKYATGFVGKKAVAQTSTGEKFNVFITGIDQYGWLCAKNCLNKTNLKFQSLQRLILLEQ